MDPDLISYMVLHGEGGGEVRISKSHTQLKLEVTPPKRGLVVNLDPEAIAALRAYLSLAVEGP